MKIHHVTDEWDYTISIDRTWDSSFLTVSILRQPEHTPACEINGVRIESLARVALERKNWDGGRWCVTNIWLRGTRSSAGVPDETRLKFLTHSNAVIDMGRIYNTLRRYERGLYSGDIK